MLLLIRWRCHHSYIVPASSLELCIGTAHAVRIRSEEDKEAVQNLAPMCARKLKQHLFHAGCHGELGQAVSV